MPGPFIKELTHIVKTQFKLSHYQLMLSIDNYPTKKAAIWETYSCIQQSMYPYY